MLDTFLAEALRRLDARLIDVCDEEERRAKLLAGDGASGWAGVRNLARPDVAELTAPPRPEAPGLLPSGEHVLRRVGAAAGFHTCELEALLVVLAAHVEPRYQSIYAVLQDDLRQPQPTERLLLAVLGYDAERRGVLTKSVGAAGKLVRSGFLTRAAGTFPPLGRPLALPEDAVAGLLGADRPPVPGARTAAWDTGTGPAGTPAAWQVVYGGGDRAAVARRLAGDGHPLLHVTVPASPADAAAACQAAWRVGLCTGALPVLDLTGLEERDVPAVAAGVEELVRGLGGRAWLLCRTPVPLAVPHTEATAPLWADRRRAWLEEARRRGAELSAAEAGRLATRHRHGSPEIRHVFDAAAHDPAAPGAAGPGVSALDAAAARIGVEHVRHSARTIPVRGFDDLVLRDTTREALDRLVHYALHRDQVAEDLGLEPRYRLQRGPVALFSGRSGTGKTLAAEAVAGALGRPLHTVDLAQLVSKYIGETEKHIDEVLSGAQRASAVLFFDEADALFSNRLEKASGASEHFANMLVGYLLQRIEVHDGLAILATNLRHGIDEAFLRRFQFRVEFPLPSAGERRRIWELMLPPGVERAADVDLEALAAAHRLSGGDIRNAALKAVFIAHRRGGPVTQADLEGAVALELLEMGRLSRRAQPLDDAGQPLVPDRGELLRACLDDLHDQLDDALRRRYLKEIHVVHGSPTQDRLAGKRPAVSVALYRLAARRGADGLRAGLIVSAWSHLAEEESELLGVVHEVLTHTRLTPAAGRPTHLRVQESHDFDLLHRFWSSHDHPVRASIVVDVEIE